MLILSVSMNFKMCNHLATLIFICQNVLTTTQTTLTNICYTSIIHMIYMCMFIYCECYFIKYTSQALQV